MNGTSSETTLGKVFSIHEFEKFSDLKTCVEKHQVLVLRGASLSIDDQIQLTKKLGQVEEAWEDRHPSNKYLQLMDSRFQKKIDVKSSSKYWHLDRSFMPQPTRFTMLHAKQIGEGARGTQFLDSRRILRSLPASLLNTIHDLEAEHDFTLRFPEIMEAKGVSGVRVSELTRKYPPSRHPLVMNSPFGEGLYFSELCTRRILDVPLNQSNRIISQLSAALVDKTAFYEHVWQPNDTLIWDNHATIHRARPDGFNGVRILHRSTAS